jgi:hypothetical protein
MPIAHIKLAGQLCELEPAILFELWNIPQGAARGAGKAFGEWVQDRKIAVVQGICVDTIVVKSEKTRRFCPALGYGRKDSALKIRIDFGALDGQPSGGAIAMRQAGKYPQFEECIFWANQLRR